MYLFFILQFVFLLVIVKPNTHHQVTKHLQIKNTCSYDCIHIATKTVQNYVMGLKCGNNYCVVYVFVCACALYLCICVCCMCVRARVCVVRVPVRACVHEDKIYHRMGHSIVRCVCARSQGIPQEL